MPTQEDAELSRKVHAKIKEIAASLDVGNATPVRATYPCFTMRGAAREGSPFRVHHKLLGFGNWLGLQSTTGSSKYSETKFLA
jgi:hypothetical protein